MLARTVTTAVVVLLTSACAGGGTETQPTPEGTAEGSAPPAASECATESDMDIVTGGSYPFFGSVEELVLASDVIVSGKVTSITCRDAARGMRDRRAVLTVDDTLHGEELARLEIVSPGDEQGGPITVDGVLPPVAGESAVWFLRSSQTVPGAFEPIGPQGRYRIDGQELTPVTHDSDREVHQVAEQIAALGRNGLEQAVAATTRGIAAGELADEWTSTSGANPVSSVRMTRGPLHCGWQDMWFLYVEVSAFPQGDPGHLRTYVANPTSGYGLEGWDPDVDLPDSAVDTGWRRGSTQLWLAEADGSGAAYLVDGSTVERLPLDDTGLGCD